MRGETEPECLAHTRFRRNEDGTIRDVTSNKKFFNMDLDQVNDRLWNGYYLTPAQFVFDIECMVRDSKSWPDRDRTNRAEEMLVNTRAYITEVFDETLVLECDRMAEREFERQKILQAEKEVKAKRKAEREREKERLRLAALQQEQANSPTKLIENAVAPDVPMLGEQEHNNPGLGLLTNGTDDTVGNVGNQVVLERSPFVNQPVPTPNQPYPSSTSLSPTRTQPYQPMPAHNGNTLAPSTNIGYETLSPRQLQPSAFPGMPQNQGQYHVYPVSHSTQTVPGIYQPSTYSNQAASFSPSHIRTDSPHGINSFGHHTSPPSAAVHYPQMHQHPQTPGPYGPQTTSTNVIAPLGQAINHTSPTRLVVPRPSPAPHPSLIRDPARIEQLLQDVTRQTEGYSLEQLEQVYAACMDVIWRLRHEWDRTVAISETEKSVRRILGEIEVMKRERQQDELNS